MPKSKTDNQSIDSLVINALTDAFKERVLTMRDEGKLGFSTDGSNVKFGQRFVKKFSGWDEKLQTINDEIERYQGSIDKGYPAYKKALESKKLELAALNTEIEVLRDPKALKEICEQVVSTPGLMNPVQNGIVQFARNSRSKVEGPATISPLIGLVIGIARAVQAVPYLFKHYGEVRPDEIFGSNFNMEKHIESLQAVSGLNGETGPVSIALKEEKFSRRNGIIFPSKDTQPPALARMYFDEALAEKIQEKTSNIQRFENNEGVNNATTAVRNPSVTKVSGNQTQNNINL